MGHVKNNTPFRPLNIAVLTVSDSRVLDEDDAGQLLIDGILAAGHLVGNRTLVKANRYGIRAVVSAWILDPNTHAILVNGGTGLNESDCVPEALIPLFDRLIDGYGELFRLLSFQSLGSSSMQSRAVAGIANKTVIFTMPGSPKACRLAWNELISLQLDARQKPCNFVAGLVSDVENCASRNDNV
ncbi:molybdenum cofactor biosynthesis protein B [Nitrincola nitratireducens]|uniref:Molybdenum cofactor biosynthesis protein B n=1 Tax=Nitrincola nitratireducens TaxID=1229521 RepID=W9VFU2_9GAMM|nr:molybdenum cofactor biosynthesis protein B [Nitrincola nitratireducens]EXJ09560.1 Molybdenum cofactor biosynthesis protein B [Nitrincola nitratireducens]